MRLITLVGLLVSIFILFAITLRLIDARNKKTAEELLSAVQDLSVGVSSETDLTKITGIANSFGNETSDCPAASGSRNIRVDGVAQHFPAAAQPLLRILGAHPWGVSVTLWTENGTLCSSSFSLAFEQELEPHSALITIKSARILGASSQDYKVDSRTQVIRGTQHLSIYVPAMAPRDQRVRGYNLNLKCLTTLHGCHDVLAIAANHF